MERGVRWHMHSVYGWKYLRGWLAKGERCAGNNRVLNSLF